MEKKITKSQTFAMIIEDLRKRIDTMKSRNEKFAVFYINGMTLYIDDYKVHMFDDEHFDIRFYCNNELLSSFHSYEMNYVYFNHTLYEII